MRYLSWTLLVVIFLGEIISQVYSLYNGGVVRILAKRDAEIAAFLGSQEVVQRRQHRDDGIAALKKSMAAKNRRNDLALSQPNGYSREMYDQKIRDDNRQMQEIISSYESWESARIGEIQKKYDRILYVTSESFLGRVVDMVYGPVASLLALVLAFYGSKVYDFRKFMALAASFVSQFFAALVTYSGISGKLGEPFGTAGFFAFFLCIPLAYSVLSDFCFGQRETAKRRADIGGPAEVITDWEISPIGWQMAIASLADEYRRGNGYGMLTQISRRFNVNKGTVHRELKKFLESGSFGVPHKLRRGEC